MVSIIFSDFDNTMLDYYSKDNYFDDYKIGVLKKIQDKGVKFCIVTGRSVSFFKQFPNLMKNIDYILGSNGACIYDVKADRYIYHNVISESDFDVVTDYLLNNKYSFFLNCRDVRYKYGVWDVVDCLDYDFNDTYVCEQIIFKVTKDKFDEVFNYLECIKGVKINNMSCWRDYWTVDINCNNVSKGISVKWLCDYLKINIDEAIAFGDGDNDKSMFEVVNKGIAVGNAIDKLKVMSKDIALGCDENGIYKYIEDNILK